MVLVLEMAAGRSETRSETSSFKTKRMEGSISLLISAACEWFLIFLLLLEAALSYFLTRFARYCQLQLPCLLCTRLDRMLGCDKQEFYQNMFCSDHRSELSSLVSCHIHGKVADGNMMCDDCLLSFNASTRQNTKSHRLLVGKLGVVLGGSGSQSPSLSKDLFAGSKGSGSGSGSGPCNCCGNPWKSEQNAPRFIQTKSPGRAIIKPYIPLPHVPRQSRLNHHHRDNLKKTRDKAVASEAKSPFQSMSNVGYTELKLTSDSDSEFPFSDDDDVVSLSNIETSNGPLPRFKPVVPPRHVLNDFNPAIANSTPPKPMPSPAPRVVPEINQHHDIKFLGSDSTSKNIPEEIKLQTENQNSSSSCLPELISIDQVSSSCIAINTTNGESEESKTASGLPQSSVPASISEHMMLDGIQTQDAASSDKSVDVTKASDTEFVSKEIEEVVKNIDTIGKESSEIDPIASDSAPVSPRQENSDNMSKSSDSTKEAESPGCVVEPPTNEEFNAVVEEMELSPSHGSNKSSRDSMDHVQSPDQDEASSSNGIKGHSKSDSVESDFEYLDDGNISEIEGESVVDKLKRKIKHDREYMHALQKELEEERNASAIATNEAMSMITRLQEEKAALQMEALQYLRMMEEQAEYDSDELEKVNDLLTEKEKEIQDLEAELEFYKMNYPEPENITVQNVGVHKDEGEDVEAQTAGVDKISNTASISGSKLTEASNVSDEDAVDEASPLEFEEEKQYITQHLKTLEKKLRQLSSNTMSTNLHEVGRLSQQGNSIGEESQLDGQEEIDLSTQKNINMSNGDCADKDGSAASDSEENNQNSTSVGSKSPVPRREVDLDALENEISDLNDRLEALELDHDFLEHIINSLRNGDDGKQFIHDIAHQLHELRKIGVRLRCIADV